MLLPSANRTERDFDSLSGGLRREPNGYTTFSAMAAYNLNADTRFMLTGSNLTDKRYHSRMQGGDRQNYFFGPEQSSAVVNLREHDSSVAFRLPVAGFHRPAHRSGSS